MFFDGSMRSVRAMMRRPPTSARSAAAASAHAGDAASSSSTPASGPSGATKVRRRLTARRGVAGHEVGLPLVAVEAAGRVAGHAVEQLGHHVVGQHAEHVGRGERRVQEVHRAQVRARLGQHPPEQREVVVLHVDGVALAGRAPRPRRPWPGCRPGSPPRPPASGGRSGAGAAGRRGGGGSTRASCWPRRRRPGGRSRRR